MKPYPKYTDFKIDDIIYGCHAPLVGMGVYTLDRKFSWPDLECTIYEEYKRWEEHLLNCGYEIPEEYKDAHVGRPDETTTK